MIKVTIVPSNQMYKGFTKEFNVVADAIEFLNIYQKFGYEAAKKETLELDGEILAQRNLVDVPIYEKQNCTGLCNHLQECADCHTPKCIKLMKHSRLTGYSCSCGSKNWKEIFDLSSI